MRSTLLTNVAQNEGEGTKDITANGNAGVNRSPQNGHPRQGRPTFNAL